MIFSASGRASASARWPLSKRFCWPASTSAATPVCSSRSRWARVLYGLQPIMAGASLALKCWAR